VNSSQLYGGKSVDEQANVCGHIAPGQNGPPQTHWVKLFPTHSAYEISLQPGQVSMAT
jgi:hypothetical protein